MDNFSQNTRKSRQSGNILLQVLFISLVFVTAIYFIASRVVSEQKVVLQTSALLRVRFALHSVLDYAFLGVQRRFCFDANLLEDSGCSLGHANSTERVLLSQEQAGFIQQMIQQNGVNMGTGSNVTADQIRSPNFFEVVLEKSKVTSQHPLFPVIETLRRDLSDLNIKVRVQRDDQPYLPHSGNEVYFSITVTFQDSLGRTLVSGATPLTVTSYATIYPRELGSFALVLPHDLRLDNGTLGTGDNAFRMYTSSSPWPATGKGLTFRSPVFVNRNIHLPPGDPKNSTAAYSPVTFADRVFLGNGLVYAGTEKFTPSTPGGASDTLWNDYKLIGGFKAGVQVDNAMDAGLLTFAGLSTPTPVDYSLMATCIARTKQKADVSLMLASELYGNRVGSATSPYTYRIGLTNGNEFNPQRGAMSAVDLSAWGTGTANRVSSPGDKAVLLATIILGDREVKAQLAVSSVFSATAQVGSTAYKQKLQKAVTDTKALPATDTTRATKIKAAEDALDAYTNLVSNPGTITVSVNPAQLAGKGPQPHLLEVQARFTNTSSFLDDKGDLVPPKIFIFAYDPTFQGSVLNPGIAFNSNLGRSINFGIDAAAILDAPSSTSVSSAVSAVKYVAEDTTDYFTLDENCKNSRNTATSQAFGAAAWNIDFSGQMRHSWNFDGTAPDLTVDPLWTSLTFSGLNSDRNNPSQLMRFKPWSIVGDCVIQSSANFISGFFVCERLVIQARTQPLEIIGTFIAKTISFEDTSGNYDTSALEAGITWSSVYQGDSTNTMRNLGLLKKKDGSACDAVGLSGTPIWHPVPSIKELADRISCNVLSLRAKANPFQWTSVDPDCGIIVGTANQTCKKHPVNYFLMEHSRGGGP